MARKFLDITNIKYNHLTAIKFSTRKNKRTYWIFQCDCENKTEKAIELSRVVSGYTKSCGCLCKKTEEQKFDKKQYHKNYRNKHKLKIKLYKKEYYSNKENKKNKAIKDKIYRINNKDKINEQVRLKKQQNLNFKLGHILRCRINRALKHRFKTGSAVKDLGCSIPKFILWIEMNWQTGMTWDNYGRDGWHIDHIRPLASFNLENHQEFLQACHFSNLQPLWSIDNLIKADNYDKL